MKKLLSLVMLLYLLPHFSRGQNKSLLQSALTKQERQKSIEENLKFETDNPENLLIYKGFAVLYNKTWKIPFFTVYQLSPEDLDQKKNKGKRSKNFHLDSFLEQKYQATPEDYENSGFDKGHMTPAGDQYWNQELKDETFLMTNICPQSPDLNQLLWEHLESAIRKMVKDSSASAWIVTGAVVNSKRSRGLSKNSIGIPSWFYKIAYINVKGRHYIFPFLIPHLYSYPDEKPEQYLSTLKEIENLCGFTFFDKLPETIRYYNGSINKKHLKWLIFQK